MTSFSHGDPAGMRALADALRRHAETVGEGAAAVRQRAYAMTYVGPAAVRFRNEIQHRHDQAFDVVTRLRDLAMYLDGAADQAEEQYREDARREADRLRRLEEEAKKAAAAAAGLAKKL